MLQKKTVESSTFELLKQLQKEPLLQDTRLVGGTALSLLIGHRVSEDLDLFTTSGFNTDDVLETLKEKFDFQPGFVRNQSIIGSIDGVKIDIIFHPFNWIRPCIEQDDVRLASVDDIVAMKLHAIINSGKRPKDFVDVAYLSQYFTYDEMKELLLRKYPAYNPIMIDKAITYFGDVDMSLVPSIKMLHEKLDFEKIKKRLYKMTDLPNRKFSKSPLYVETKSVERKITKSTKHKIK